MPCSLMLCCHCLPPSYLGPFLQQVCDPGDRVQPVIRVLSPSVLGRAEGLPVLMPGPPLGMGSQARPHSILQGFGYSKEQDRAGKGGGPV